WRASCYVQRAEKGVLPETALPLSYSARAGFSAHCRIDDPRWREAVIRTGTDADRKIGPAARSFAADAHDCIMVRTPPTYRIQVCSATSAPKRRAPLGSSADRTVRRRSFAKARRSSSSLRVLRRQ